jgi:hypothetical protein
MEFRKDFFGLFFGFEDQCFSLRYLWNNDGGTYVIVQVFFLLEMAIAETTITTTIMAAAIAV